MKLALTFFLLAIQMRDNRDMQLNCSNFDDQSRFCEMHESTLGPAGRLDIEAGRNGQIIVKGWSQNSVLVRSRVQVWADTDADARMIASQIHVDTIGAQIRATGPDLNGVVFSDRINQRWATSFEVFIPWNTDLKLGSHNGRIDIADVRGRIEFESHNGGARLSRVAGDITGTTHNGGIQVELEGDSLRQMDLTSHNGSVALSLPSSLNASVESHSRRGRLETDFPVAVSGDRNRNDLRFNIGSGGPLIKVNTNNGGLQLKKR